MKKRKMKKVKPVKKYREGNSNRMIVILAVVILVLATVIVYSFALKPSFNGYVVSKQVEAQDIVLNALLSQLQQNGYIQIPIGDEILTLVPYQPEQQQELAQ